MTATNNLIKEFCQSIGMEGLGLDENKQRSLCFDDKIVITFIGDDNDCITGLTYIHEAKTPADLRKLLEQNFLAEAHGGARFALEPNTERIIMSRVWNAVKTSVPEFSNDLEAMVNSALQAQKFFDGGGAIETSKETGDAPPKVNLADAYQAV